MAQRQTNDFSVGSIPRTIIRIALPMIAAQIINALYNIVDRIFIGQIPEIGRLALTGVGLTFPIIMIITAFTNLCGAGGAPLCSIARGEGNLPRAEKIIGNAFTLLLFFGVILTVLGLIFKAPILYLFGASPDTFSYANGYITIYLCGSMFVMIGLGMNPYINSQGFTKIGMLTVLVGAVTNIILDPIFIFLFNMGVQGAALATIISQCLSAIWVLRFLRSNKAILHIKLKNLKPDFPLMRRILGLGLSNFTMAITESSVQIVCNASLQIHGGDIYVGIMTIINSIRQMLMLPLSGFASGTIPVISFNYGAKKYDRVRESIRFLILCCIGYTVIVCAFVEIFPETLIRIFNSDPSLLQNGMLPVRIYYMMFWLLCLQMAGQTSFLALGKSKQAIFFSLLRKGIVVIPLVLLLPGAFGLGVYGVFIAEPISDFIGSAACFTTFMCTVYRRLKTLQTNPLGMHLKQTAN